MLPIRWEPRRDLQEIDRLFGRAMRRPFASFQSWPSIWDGHIRPALDAYETPEELVIKVTIPGVKADDLKVTVNNGTLVISGEAREEQEEKKEHYLLRERRSGAIHRAVALPEGLDTEKSEAIYEDGVLTVTLPKTEQAKPREISVKVKETAKAKKA